VDRIEVARGIEVTRDFALFLREERALIISDLHLGFEGALAEQGVSIPRFQRRVVLERLGRMLDRVKAEKVVVAGDFKHEFSRNLTDEWIEVKQVLRFLRDRVTPVLVRGNHDNYLATILGDLNLALLDRADLGGFTIVHGHEEVSTLHPIVMGHEHPAVKLKDELGAVVSVPAFLVTDRLIVLPAFSPLALGVDVSSYPYLSPILNRTGIDDARVIGVDEREGLLDFGHVRGLKQLRAALLMK
jgi:putative SbcD/Mre11-related phosphoesterase